MAIGRVRPSVAALNAYRPGKGAKQAEAEHGITDAIKLASNENPYAPVPSVLAAIADATGGVNRYADHRAMALRGRISQWLGFDEERIAVGCGSVGLLQQLCLAYLDAGDEAIYPWISFEAYPVLVKMMGAVPVTPALVDYKIDMDAVAAAVTSKTKAIFLATPNNPTGTALDTEQITKLLTQVPSDVLVIVDEAYREFSDPALGDPASLCAQHDNLVVLRTFSKAYGLAGLRIGYAVAHPDVVAEIDKCLLAFAVNGLAQAGALAALNSLDEIQPKIDLVLSERTRTIDALTKSGWSLPDAQANFVFLPLGDRTDEIALGLEKRGVVVRPFSGDGIRVTIGTPGENDRFLWTLASVAEE